MASYALHDDPEYDAKTAAGCLAAGEPTFLLRAQDRYASDLVRIWAERVDDDGLRSEARKIADAMDAWPVTKEPD